MKQKPRYKRVPYIEKEKDDFESICQGCVFTRRGGICISELACVVEGKMYIYIKVEK